MARYPRMSFQFCRSIASLEISYTPRLSKFGVFLHFYTVSSYLLIKEFTDFRAHLCTFEIYMNLFIYTHVRILSLLFKRSSQKLIKFIYTAMIYFPRFFRFIKETLLSRPRLIKLRDSLTHLCFSSTFNDLAGWQRATIKSRRRPLPSPPVRVSFPVEHQRETNGRLNFNFASRLIRARPRKRNAIAQTSDHKHIAFLATFYANSS